MPSVSKAQFRAMQAANHGTSTLGIPQSVGAEFVEATDEPSELPESAEAEAAEHQKYCSERCEHHRKMARKAGSPAARAVHKKLQAHYKNQMKG